MSFTTSALVFLFAITSAVPVEITSNIILNDGANWTYDCDGGNGPPLEYAKWGTDGVPTGDNINNIKKIHGPITVNHAKYDGAFARRCDRLQCNENWAIYVCSEVSDITAGEVVLSGADT